MHTSPPRKRYTRLRQTAPGRSGRGSRRLWREATHRTQINPTPPHPQTSTPLQCRAGSAIFFAATLAWNCSVETQVRKQHFGWVFGRLELRSKHPWTPTVWHDDVIWLVFCFWRGRTAHEVGEAPRVLHLVRCDVIHALPRERSESAYRSHVKNRFNLKTIFKEILATLERII